MNNFSIFIAEDEDDRFLIERDWEESGTNEKIDFVENGVEDLNHLNNIKSRKIKNNYPQFIS